MLAMSTLMMPAPTMACAPPIAVGPHKPPGEQLNRIKRAILAKRSSCYHGHILNRIICKILCELITIRFKINDIIHIGIHIWMFPFTLVFPFFSPSVRGSWINANQLIWFISLSHSLSLSFSLPEMNVPFIVISSLNLNCGFKKRFSIYLNTYFVNLWWQPVDGLRVTFVPCSHLKWFKI